VRQVLAILALLAALIASGVLAASFTDQARIEALAKSLVAHRLETSLEKRFPSLADPESVLSRHVRAALAPDGEGDGARTLVETLERLVAPLCLCKPQTLQRLDAAAPLSLRARAVLEIRAAAAEGYRRMMAAMLWKIRLTAGTALLAGLMLTAACLFPRRETGLRLLCAVDATLCAVSGVALAALWLMPLFFVWLFLASAAWCLPAVMAFLLLLLADALFADGAIAETLGNCLPGGH
jgi:hypothetical protein